jgi:hypothetical protein
MSPSIRREEPRPATAWWSESDKEWVEGPRDAEGRLHGLIRYWDAEGRFISECEHVHGQPHGQARRFYADGSLAQVCTYAAGRLEGARTVHRPADPKLNPPPPLAHAPSGIAVYECEYAGGDLVATRFRDSSGAEVDSQGTRIPPRPPGVGLTASPMPDGKWLAMRRRGENGNPTLDLRIWYADGQLCEEKLEDGHCRSFHPTGALREEGWRIHQGSSRPENGVWRYGDAAGVVRRESLYDAGVERTRLCRRPVAEAGPEGTGGVVRTGPVAPARDRGDAVECGRWELRDEHGKVLRIIELGEPVDERTLLADPALSDDADEEALRRRIAEGAAKEPGGAGTRLARLRLAGRTGRVEEVQALCGPGPAWTRLSRDGEVTLFTHWQVRLGELVHALEWGVPASEVLGELAARLLRADRPRTALELIDAARLTSDALALREARITSLRALGREDEATRELEGLQPDRIDAHEEALLLGLREDPGDMGRWLRYAEAITEARPAHAARIRTAWGDGGPDALDAVLQALQAELPDTFDGSIAGQGRVWVEAEQFLAHHDALFRAAPLATELVLEGATDVMARLVVLPALRRYTSLALSETLLFDGGATQLARSPHLGQLVHLGLANTHLHDEDLRAILGSRAFPGLTSLDISNYREGQDYGLDGLGALAEAAFAGSLEELTMERRWLGEELVSVLAALPRLNSLGLDCGSLGDEGVRALVSLPHRWTHLGLRANDIGDAGAVALADSAALTELRWLYLGDNELTDEGVLALARSPHLTALEWLDLGRMNLSSKTREELRARFGERVKLAN